MIGVNDVNVEQFTLADADLLRNFARENNLWGLSMWSANRDYPCADKSPSITCSGNNLQSKTLISQENSE
jgi:chitinase